MKPIACSFQAGLGYSVAASSLSTISFFSAWFGGVRFHVAKTGEATRVQIRVSRLFGLFASTWEIMGPVGSKHRLPNGSTLRIGKQSPGTSNDIPVTLLEFERAPAMWKKTVPVPET
ncbi:hypothetical protein A3C20_03150 [Candidatus Kaiserbacteria bacterium RIFCSPHIGHO2_02_FULL_55_25]|uniref:Uncharacterized protein n=1 Tax=Candidatus Kaiserbacteria bacterium RIFCSPHIGHO2_02_FULL_55_25 TaxID=1798498 RepID=A0A1F6E7U4_9BACT|nr:MAG: hypothetical protein A2764_02890 [Candidatus Kaiserbacteria bacterium RIFCSPHIGHO2_01_FULL_55_79]OGG69262.1 MAG: hypothetical protein A3C20_03150 [Candidatus Kaiserbacteria bacterium RIFCSPHIGHO2_02_FULL_55_25]OGG77028.1 MAG: hypothetical protein A3F56_01035 [Candidatus Kaiserbacteria bacterium RIFCSPHIGHO2_12_FULL_55_13]OGG83896.1 MAG: hypothetical protein A3A42_00155 [Candidatus Kaiserbacteria bacterium RIFCSPLOWO2_01_FULL_55_25]